MEGLQKLFDENKADLPVPVVHAHLWPRVFQGSIRETP